MWHTTKVSSRTYPRGLAASALSTINEETRPAHPSSSLSGQWCFLETEPRACRSDCLARWGARRPCLPCTWPGLADYQISSHWQLEEKERAQLATGHWNSSQSLPPHSQQETRVSASCSINQRSILWSKGNAGWHQYLHAISTDSELWPFCLACKIL